MIEAKLNTNKERDCEIASFKNINFFKLIDFLIKDASINR